MNLDDLLLAAQGHQQIGLVTLVLLIERSMGKTKYGSIMGLVLALGTRIFLVGLQTSVKVWLAIRNLKKGKTDANSG